jgi:hypothetical protein
MDVRVLGTHRTRDRGNRAWRRRTPAPPLSLRGHAAPPPSRSSPSSRPAPPVADADAAGFVHGRALGSARIRVTYESGSDSAEVAVLPPVLVGAGDIAGTPRPALWPIGTTHGSRRVSTGAPPRPSRSGRRCTTPAPTS